jgi:hypothetical protein
MQAAQQKSTESTRQEITPIQSRVIEALVRGSSVRAASEGAGIDRSTFYLWCRTDALFLAELNRTRQEHINALRARLGELAAEAANVVSDLLKRDDTPPAVRLKASLAVLQAVGVLDREAIGDTDDERIARRWADEEEGRKQMKALGVIGIS